MKRIQRKRTRGWRMPEDAVYVGRPSRWGNPWVIESTKIARHPDGTPWDAEDLTRWYGNYARVMAADPAWLDPLRGHDLVCWCPLVDAEGKPVPCHADVLLELANR
jgi:hypothetical protein